MYYNNQNVSAPPFDDISMPMPAPPTYQMSINQNQNLNNDISREEKFRNILNKHEISIEFSKRLQQLLGFKIVFIFDDSGSMNTPLNDSPLNNNNTLFKATRWDELQYFAKISIEIASLFNPDGCNIYFLNRYQYPIKNVTNEVQLTDLFRERPQGFTPLPRVLDNVLNDTSMLLNENKLLIIIATDGEPTDDSGQFFNKQ